MQQVGHRTTLATLALTLGLGSVACASSDSKSSDTNSTTVDCSTGSVPKFSELTGLSKCTSCHSSALTGAGRSDAPVAVNYDQYAAAKDMAELGLDEVESGSMPPSGSPQLTTAEIEAIKRWATCGTPQ